jgi:hypothetical protein
MKRKILNLAAITLALCLSAFTLWKPSNQASYYWFPLSTAGFAQTVNTLVYQHNDPQQCGNFPLETYCQAAYTSYSGTTAPYSAAGMVVFIDYHYPWWLPH